MHALIVFLDPAQDMAPEVPAEDAVVPEIENIDMQIRRLELRFSTASSYTKGSTHQAAELCGT